MLLLAAAAPANARAERLQVVIAEDGGAPEHPVLARLRAELRREGYDVVDEAQGNAQQVAATVRFEPREPELKLDVTVRPAAHSELSRRSFHGDLSDSRTVVLRAVEYILASQLDQLEGEARSPSPAAPPKAVATNAAPRFRSELGAVAFLGVPGADPALGAALAAGYAVAPRYRVGVRAAGTAPNVTRTPRGAARFSHGLVTVGGSWEQPLADRFTLELGLSGGVYVLRAVGESTSELQAQSTLTWVPAGTLGAGTRFRLTSSLPLGVYARGEALFGWRRPAVRFGAETIERMSQPSLLASAGVELSF